MISRDLKLINKTRNIWGNKGIRGELSPASIYKSLIWKGSFFLQNGTRETYLLGFARDSVAYRTQRKDSHGKIIRARNDKRATWGLVSARQTDLLGSGHRPTKKAKKSDRFF